MNELKDEHAKRHAITVDTLLAELEEVRSLALVPRGENGAVQLNVAVNAIMGKAKPSLSLDDAKQLLIDDTAKHNEYLPTYRQLTALQQALLGLIAMSESQPYSTATTDQLGKRLGVEITTPAI